MSSRQAPPDLRLPSIEGLRAFEAAARLGSLERAAEGLAVSASAVGKRIATLEALLGLELFARGAKPLRLSAAGKEYLEQVQAALALLAAVPLHRRPQQRLTRLRLSAPPTFARQILVPALPAFARAHPALELELVLSVPYLDTQGPDADLEVRNGEPPPGALPLLRDVVTPMAAPELLQRLPALRRPADLQAAPLLRTPLQPWTPWFRAAGLDWGEPRSGTRFVDLGLTLEAAACGQGIALARPTLAGPYLRRGALQRLFDLQVPAAHPYALLCHAEGEAVRATADWLRGHCAALAEEFSGAG